jgi:hypothetical protein
MPFTSVVVMGGRGILRDSRKLFSWRVYPRSLKPGLTRIHQERGTSEKTCEYLNLQARSGQNECAYHEGSVTVLIIIAACTDRRLAAVAGGCGG